MNYVYATVIIADADKAAAQTVYPDYFNSPASPDGTEPATNWFTSGPFDDTELQDMINNQAWPKKVYFGQDWQAALAQAGLQQVIPAPAPTPLQDPNVIDVVATEVS